MLNITIHRGHNQIGGCITEIACDGAKIFIDFGSNLPGNSNEDFTADDVHEICKGADAVFYTHYHGDHVGLMKYVDPDIPQYIGKGAKEVMVYKLDALNSKNEYDEDKLAACRMRTYSVAKKININNRIFVKPLLVSHSAFDAYMFKIECDGKTILHTGDFRKHGYIGGKLEDMLTKYVGKVDILITEGTMLGRSCEHVIHEHQIEQNTISLLRNHKYVFALCSSTDIDRLASFHQACKETGRHFFIDSYQKGMLDIFTQYSGPYSDLFKFDNLTVSSADYSYQSTQSLRNNGFLMLIRKSKKDKIKNYIYKFCKEEPWLIYSMWNGYAEEGKPYADKDIIEIRNIFGDRIKDGTKDGFHTSGHADVKTLSRICNLLQPRLGVIPIHKDAKTRYTSLKEVDRYTVFPEGITETDNVKIDIR